MNFQNDIALMKIFLKFCQYKFCCLLFGTYCVDYHIGIFALSIVHVKFTVFTKISLSLSMHFESADRAIFVTKHLTLCAQVFFQTYLSTNTVRAMYKWNKRIGRKSMFKLYTSCAVWTSFKTCLIPSKGHHL